MSRTTIAYLDMPSGISGDMLLGCLVDAGWDVAELRRVIDALRLPAGTWSVEAKEVAKGAIRAKLVEVRVTEGAAAGAGEADVRAATPAAEVLEVLPLGELPVFSPVRPGPHGHGHGHAHRNLHDVTAIIRRSTLGERVKERAVAVFRRLAEAEAKVHGSTIEQVHFHEVGALDAIVDIVGAVAGLEALGVEQLWASPVPAGGGWVNTAHGKLPVPAPATLEILAAAGAPIRGGETPDAGELVTPTGAALVAELARFGRPAMTLTRVGIGAGTRDLPWPNAARLMIGAADGEGEGDLVELATNIDDMNPQFYAPAIDALLAAGALDAWLTPVQMKKGRPGVVLTALGRAADEAKLADVILRQTTTLGVRVRRVMRRHEAGREVRTVRTPHGPVRVKVKLVGGQATGATPEYEDCKALAEAKGVPVRVVYDAAMAAAGGAKAEG